MSIDDVRSRNNLSTTELECLESLRVVNPLFKCCPCCQRQSREVHSTPSFKF